jgi:hypothetical protein
MLCVLLTDTTSHSCEKLFILSGKPEDCWNCISTGWLDGRLCFKFQPTYRDGARVNKHPPVHHAGWMVCGQEKISFHFIPDPYSNHPHAVYSKLFEWFRKYWHLMNLHLTIKSQLNLIVHLFAGSFTTAVYGSLPGYLIILTYSLIMLSFPAPG